MKDCTTCEHGVERHPEYAAAEWECLPCSTCRVNEPPRHGVVEYGQQFEHPSARTWRVVDPLEAAEAATERASLLMEYLGATAERRALIRLSPGNEIVARFASLFTPRQELDIIDFVVNWHKSIAANGRQRGRSRVAQWKAMQKIRALIDSIGDEVEIG